MSMVHGAGIEPAWRTFKACMGYQQPARVYTSLDQAAGVEPAWRWFRATMGYRQPAPE